MATPLQTFRLFTAARAPLTSATPGFLVYCDGAGTDVLPHPDIVEIEQGKYGFVFDDAAAVRVWQIDGGSLAVPRYVTGGNGGDVQVFGTYDVLGAPTAPGMGSPNFILYVDAADATETQPSILNPATGLFFFLPSPADIDEGRAFVIRTDSDGLLFPDSYDGTVGNVPSGGGTDTTPPTVTLVSPGQGGIGPDSTIVVDVTDAGGLRLVVLSAEWPDIGLEEVINRGAFSTKYAGSSMAPISGGMRLSFKRAGGFPEGTMKLHIDVVDQSGNEA